MEKIKNTNLDEQYVAFALIDSENFINRLYEEEIITTNEYEVMSNMFKKIGDRCSFKKEDE